MLTPLAHVPVVLTTAPAAAGPRCSGADHTHEHYETHWHTHHWEHVGTYWDSAGRREVYYLHEHDNYHSTAPCSDDVKAAGLDELTDPFIETYPADVASILGPVG